MPVFFQFVARLSRSLFPLRNALRVLRGEIMRGCIVGMRGRRAMTLVKSRGLFWNELEVGILRSGNGSFV